MRSAREMLDGPPQAGLTTPYEKRLDQDAEWALVEGSLFFEGKGAVHDALRRITKRLDELHISYAVAGGMALFHHGLRRFTDDVHLLVTREGLKAVHQHLVGLGYRPAFLGAKNLRDTQDGVKIEFLTEGGFPGDGKPKPISFPNPETVAVEMLGVRCLSLTSLIELKLASGMTNPDRLKDLVDVQELIKLRNLPLDFSGRLHRFVREKYDELWRATRATPKRFVMLWRNKFLTLDAASLAEMTAAI